VGQVATLKAGEVVVADFPGITGVKRRPAVVVSTDAYHSHRSDVILGAIATNLTAATTPMDYTLNDWAAAGLHHPSAFRTFLVTLPQAQVLVAIGHLSDMDWVAVQGRLQRAIAI
jgi:mRNA-degrading endonuclease toxin of MazEF toxin-antitoxin module